MTNSKPFILSALLCLTFTVGMISYLLISDVPEKIRILNQKITLESAEGAYKRYLAVDVDRVGITAEGREWS